MALQTAARLLWAGAPGRQGPRGLFQLRIKVNFTLGVGTAAPTGSLRVPRINQGPPDSGPGHSVTRLCVPRRARTGGCWCGHGLPTTS